MALLSDVAGAAKNIARIIIDAIQWTIANVRLGSLAALEPNTSLMSAVGRKPDT